MKIALIGYGRMGREVESLARSQGHDISLVIDNENDWSEKGGKLKRCHVAIEFTTPGTVVNNLYRCIDLQVPVVTGTTGWKQQLGEVRKKCLESGGSLFYASNFSIGVNIFFEINRRLAALMSDNGDYEPSIEEIHHIHKLDAPSGTAITLADDILEASASKTAWVNGPSGNPSDLLIRSVREGAVPGTHSVNWDGINDSITITHAAKSRAGFASGALLAALFLQGRQGIFTMKDLLNF
jgi:4-hydroxy-tetrahydrodipicolinate reductase